MQRPSNVYYGDLSDSPLPYTNYSYTPFTVGNNSVIYPVMYTKCYECANRPFATIKDNSTDCGSGYFQLVPIMKGEPCQNKSFDSCNYK